MIKTLKTVFQRDKEKFVIPKSVQDTIPVQTVYADGIFKVGSNKYSKTFKFADINYSVSSDEDKKTIFLAYEELLNSFDSAATTKITVNNRKLNKEEFEKEILLENQDDGLDYLRKEYNEMLKTKVTASNALIQEKYITVSINKKSVDDARTYFNRVGSELSSRFARLGSVCAPVELDERLKIIHDFYMPDDELSFRFDLKEAMQKGHDFKDTICPDSMECEKGYFRIGDKYARVLFLRDYASYIKDVLSIYAIKTTTDPDNPMEIATVDENKKSILSTIFWDMNSIDSKAETRTETKEITSTDENGNEIITTDEITVKILTITISSKNADDMSKQYSFDDKQKEYLAELMNDSNDKLWASIIFSTGGNTNVDIDFDALDFGDETVNDTQRKIVVIATNSESYGISAKSGYCQAWVADVYQAVTGKRGHAHCALCAADMWAVSQDFNKIQVGATVYGYSSSQFGHVGIYIGNGKVIHNLSGTVKVQSLKSWVKDFKGFAWGWENGENLI